MGHCHHVALSPIGLVRHAPPFGGLARPALPFGRFTRRLLGGLFI